MNLSLTAKIVLLLSGSIMTGIGLAVLILPAPFYATNGIALGANPSLLNEVRASGGALAGAGGLVLAGLFVSGLARLSMVIAAVLYGMYGISRLFSMAIDGMPADGLTGAAILELLISALCLFVLVRENARARSPLRTANN